MLGFVFQTVNLFGRSLKALTDECVLAEQLIVDGDQVVAEWLEVLHTFTALVTLTAVGIRECSLFDSVGDRFDSQSCVDDLFSLLNSEILP